MFPGVNPNQMKKMMNQMGIKSDEIKASKVVIYCSGSNIVIENPQVTAIEMQGQKTFQIGGSVKVETAGSASDEDKKQSEDDVKMVMEQANVSREAAESALKTANGDIAEAIMKLEK